MKNSLAIAIDEVQIEIYSILDKATNNRLGHASDDRYVARTLLRATQAAVACPEFSYTSQGRLTDECRTAVRKIAHTYARMNIKLKSHRDVKRKGALSELYEEITPGSLDLVPNQIEKMAALKSICRFLLVNGIRSAVVDAFLWDLQGHDRRTICRLLQRHHGIEMLENTLNVALKRLRKFIAEHRDEFAELYG